MGISYLHDNQLVHRDIKPEHILLDKNLNAKIFEFKVCAKVKAQEKRESFCGTYEYMAPEVYESSEHDQKADIWSLGVLLYEIIEGSSPFLEKTAFRIYKNILD